MKLNIKTKKTMQNREISQNNPLKLPHQISYQRTQATQLAKKRNLP